MKKFDLEERLIDFSVQIIKTSEKLPQSFAVNHLSKQIIRSSTSAALNYGEAQSGESRKDFIHKMQIALKELRETSVGLRILSRSGHNVNDSLDQAIVEVNELISIFVKSISTAKSKAQLV